MLWVLLAGVGLLAVVQDVVGAISANRQGRNYSFVSTIVFPPLMVILGVLSLVGGGDSWIFNNVLGLMLLLGGVALIAAIIVLINRGARPNGSAHD